MRSETFLLCVVIVLALTVVGTVLAMESDPAFGVIPATMAMLVVYVLATSTYRILPDRMVVGFFFDDYIGAFVPRTFIRAHPSLSGLGLRGLLGTDFVILLWPFCRAILLPTGAVVIRYSANRVYTKDGGGLPLNVDFTVTIQLGEDLPPIVVTFQLLEEDNYDFARTDKVVYVVDRDPKTGESKTQEYRGPRLAQALYRSTETVVHRALRDTISKHTWEEIKGEIATLEDEIKLALSQEDSVFVQGGLLDQARTGRSVLSIDLNVEDITPADDKMATALSFVLIAQQEAKAAEQAAEAAKHAGEGEGKRIKAIMNESGLTAEQVRAFEALQKAGNLNIFTTNEGLAQVIENLASGMKKPRRP